MLAGVLTFESDGVGGTPGVWAGVGITGASEVGIMPSEISHSRSSGRVVRSRADKGAKKGGCAPTDR